MEDRSIDHKMDHYFSYDAPQQGANTPLGLQYIFQEMVKDLDFLLWNFGGSAISRDFESLASAARSPAARQMLVTKAIYNDGPFNWDPNLYTLDPARAKFAQDLVNKGYPQNLTRHGIAFGRGDNTAATKDAGNGVQFGNFVPTTKIFDGDINYVLIALITSAFAVPENGNTSYIARYRFAGIKVIRLFGIPVPIRYTLRIRNFKYTGQYPYDDAPGSYESTQTQFVDQFNKYGGIAPAATNYGHHGHNFVSTASALDLQNQGYGSSNAWQSNNMFTNIDNSIVNPGQVTGNALSNTALSPFHYVLTYTSDCAVIGCESINDDVDNDGNSDIKTDNWNQYHNGFISKQASHFIQRKIINAVPGTTCPGLCANTNVISGASPVCTTSFFEIIDNNLSGINIHWEILNGRLEITGGQGTPRITVSKITTGPETVRVTLTNSCGQIRVIERIVQAGLFTPSFDLAALDGDYCQGQTFEAVAISNNTGTITYNWYVNGVLDSYHGFKLRRTFPANHTTIGLRVSVPGCGLSNLFSQTYDCSLGFRVSPNPSRSNIKVESTSTSIISEIKITDKLNNVKKWYKYPPKTRFVNISVADLPVDIYFIQVFDGKTWITIPLSVQ